MRCAPRSGWVFRGFMPRPIVDVRYSLCRGLIEPVRDDPPVETGIPRLYAAASLKLVPRIRLTMSLPYCGFGYSAALCRGLIEALVGLVVIFRAGAILAGIPRLYAAASLKRGPETFAPILPGCGIPRLYAAASLKPMPSAAPRRVAARYSAALCRGLIEARQHHVRESSPYHRIPRLYAAASLKRLASRSSIPTADVVFRGFMPRPH